MSGIVCDAWLRMFALYLGRHDTDEKWNVDQHTFGPRGAPSDNSIA